MNLLSWGSNNVVAVALQQKVYLWNAENSKIDELLTLPDNGDVVTSVQWTPGDGRIAIGTSSCTVQVDVVLYVYINMYISICIYEYI